MFKRSAMIMLYRLEQQREAAKLPGPAGFGERDAAIV